MPNISHDLRLCAQCSHLQCLSWAAQNHKPVLSYWVVDRRHGTPVHEEECGLFIKDQQQV